MGWGYLNAENKGLTDRKRMQLLKNEESNDVLQVGQIIIILDLKKSKFIHM